MAREVIKKTSTILFGCCLVCLASCARTQIDTEPNATIIKNHNKLNIWVLATAHSFHLEKDFGYSLSDLMNQILSIKPDIVCGEIVREHYDTKLSGGLYPLENVPIEYAANKAGALFWPSDWRIDHRYVDEIYRVENLMTEIEKNQYNHAYDIFMPKFKAAFGTEIFEFFHSNETQQIIRNVHETMINAGSEIAAGFWDTRNQMIVKNCIRKSEKMGAKKIVFTYGGEHKYGIEFFLKRFYRLKTKPVVRLFSPSNDPMPKEVLQKWKEQRIALIEVIQDQNTPKRLRKMLNSYNMKDKLKKAIDMLGQAHCPS